MLGISVDSIPGLQAWQKTLGGIMYPLLSDFWPHGETARKYGVLTDSGYCDRTIFIIDKKGIIALPWCLKENCAQEIENILDGNTLGEPIEGDECNYPCPVCGETGKTWMRFAKTY